MASSRPAQHTGHLGAPGTTGAVETHDPLGAPGSTGASPTTPTAGYDAGGQGQLHRVPLQGTAQQGYAYGTAAGHAGVFVPPTTGLRDTGAKKSSDSDRGAGIGHEERHGRGHDTGGDKGDTGGIGHEERHGRGHDTGGDKGDTEGIGHEERHGRGHDTDEDKGDNGGIGQRGHQGQDGDQPHRQGVKGDKTHGQEGGGYDTRAHGQDLGVGYWAGSEGGGYDTSDLTHGQGVKEQSVHHTSGDKTCGQEGGGYDTRAHGQDLGLGDWAGSEGGSYGQGIKEHGGGGDKSQEQGVEGNGDDYDMRKDRTQGQEAKEHGGEKAQGQGVEAPGRGYDDMPPRSGSGSGSGSLTGSDVGTTFIEVVEEEPVYEEENKGIIDKLMERIP